jgi:hypothetical protein
MAMLVLGAVASATASANPTILPTPTVEKPLTFTSEAGKTTISSTAGTIECEKLKNTGKFITNESGSVEIDLENCKLASTGSKCKTTGDVNGILLVTANITVVDILPESKLELGLLLEFPETILITCGVVKVELKGDVIGHMDGIKSLVKTKATELLFREVKGQEFKECDLLEEVCLKEGKHIIFQLLIKFTPEEVFKEGRLASEDKLTFVKEFEAHF